MVFTFVTVSTGIEGVAPVDVADTKRQRVVEILEEAIKLYKAKDADYSGDVPLSNFRSSVEYGLQPWRAVLAGRFSDKVNRIKKFCRDGMFEVTSETMCDTLTDGLVYLAIARALYEEEFGEVDLLEKEGIV